MKSKHNEFFVLKNATNNTIQKLQLCLKRKKENKCNNKI